MNVQAGKFYIDNEENVYKCIAVHQKYDYAEAVMQLEEGEFGTLFFCVFYRSHYAWLDRENPEYKLTDEVEYFPSLVPRAHS